jgi:large subunit ribosomal protein L13
VLQTQPNTHFFRPDEVERKWYVVDVEGKTLGRVASGIAKILRGKHKPTFTPNNDVGDFVVVINAEKVQLTGKRTELKQLFHNTGYPGGGRFELVRDMLTSKPERVIEHAVKGMLPKTRLGRRIGMKLKVYRGSAHPHAAQQPEKLDV